MCAMALLTSSRTIRVRADHWTTVSVSSRSAPKAQPSVTSAAVRRCVRSAFHSAAASPSLWPDAARPRVSVFRSFSVWRTYSSISGDGALYISVSSRAPMSSCRSCARRWRSSRRPARRRGRTRRRAPSCSTMRSGQARVLEREAAPPALGEAQTQRDRRRHPLARQRRDRDDEGRPFPRRGRATPRPRRRPAEEVAQELEQQGRTRRVGLDLACDAVQLVEHALRRQRVPDQLAQDPPARGRVPGQGAEQRQRQRRELTEENRGHEEQVERDRDQCHGRERKCELAHGWRERVNRARAGAAP